jgi:hypothetical protein
VSYAQQRRAELIHHSPKPKRNQRKGVLYKTDHLTREDFGLIRELARYLPHREIARKFETSATHVSRIVNFDTPEPLR